MGDYELMVFLLVLTAMLVVMQALMTLDRIAEDCTYLRLHVPLVERALADLRPLNAHAGMLGQVVEARKYEASDWETYVVCAVSWHGSLCLRSIDHPAERGFWVHHDKVADRVRELRVERARSKG